MQAGRDRLPDVHVARDDDAVDRAPDLAQGYVGDGGIAIGARLCHPRFRGAERGSRAGPIRRRRLRLGAGDEALLEQLGEAKGSVLRVEEHHARLLDVGVRRQEAGRRPRLCHLEEAGIDLGKELTLLHRRIEVDVEPGDGAGDLRSDSDGDDRGNLAGRRHRLRKRALADRLGLEGEMIRRSTATAERQRKREGRPDFP